MRSDKARLHLPGRSDFPLQWLYTKIYIGVHEEATTKLASLQIIVAAMLNRTLDFIAKGIRKHGSTLIPRNDIDKALDQLCALPARSNANFQPCISDEDFQRVANLLRHLEIHLKQTDWCKRPRTYTVLPNIGRQDMMSAFINLGLTDYSFPYSPERIPDALEGDIVRERFMVVQSYVLSQATQLENGSDGLHAHTKNGEDLFHRIRQLGTGGYDSVNEVFSRLNFKTYAQKIFMRKKNAEDDRKLITRFINKISNLKRLSHRHLVRLIGSYTEKRSVAYLMEAVADCNLMVFLQQPVGFLQTRLTSLRSYYCCLASAVAYLHRQRVRHRDLKPQNILIKGLDIFITDFGTAHDWSKRARDTTQNPETPFSENYMAPEVAKRSPRNSASDMWSLGVVFLDMTTALRSATIKQMKGF